MQQGLGQYEAETVGEIREDGVLNGVQYEAVGSDEQPLLPVQSGSEMMPTVGQRPKREKRPNVKYSSEEYDLSKVSAAKTQLMLSGLYMQQCRPRHRGRYQKKSRRL